MKHGYTTGTCAAAAAKAAAMMLCGASAPRDVEIGLPQGGRVSLPVRFAHLGAEHAEAAVRKRSGDDPDATDGMEVVARVSFRNGVDILFEAGEGVGIVTRPGLVVPPGEPAINPTPRRMIRAALEEVAHCAFCVRIAIPGGKEIAKKTFNPRLGIVGGLSILGTTGRVRPFSVPAMIESLKCALDVAAACNAAAPVLVPGHIGERAARRHFLLGPEQVVPVGNHWGAMLDAAARGPFTHLLLMGHPGKLAKIVDGEWNTHSASSPGAVPIVLRLAREHPGLSAMPAPTVEGIFAALPAPQSRELADALAAHILRRVWARIGGQPRTAVALINMNGTLLGFDGDLSPWPKK